MSVTTQRIDQDALVPMIASGALTANMVVRLGTTAGTVRAPAAGQPASGLFGVTMAAAADGAQVDVYPFACGCGKVRVISNAAIALNAFVTATTTTGRVETAAPTAATAVQIIGVALTSTSDAGQYLEIAPCSFVSFNPGSGSILPAADNTSDLGSVAYQWRRIYAGTGIVGPSVESDEIDQNGAAGLTIGGAASQLGFFGAATSAQPAAEAALTPTVIGDFAGAAPTSAECVIRLNLIETKVNNLLAKLRTLGLIAT